MTYYSVVIPIWLLLVILTIPIWLCWRKSRRLSSHDDCDKCAYNLTGNTSGICPECGTPVPEDVKKTLVLSESGPIGDHLIDPEKQDAG